jgi:hypothetical protein
MPTQESRQRARRISRSKERLTERLVLQWAVGSESSIAPCPEARSVIDGCRDLMVAAAV